MQSAIGATQYDGFLQFLLTLLHVASAAGRANVVSWLIGKQSGASRFLWPAICLGALALLITPGHRSTAPYLIEHKAPTEGNEWHAWDGSALLTVVSSSAYETAGLTTFPRRTVKSLSDRDRSPLQAEEAGGSSV